MMTLALLLSVPAGATPVLGPTLFDRDAACAWAALQVAVGVQRIHDDTWDSWAPALQPAGDLPMPAACRDRVTVWVDAIEGSDVHTCARVLLGPGAGRAFCAWSDGEVTEQAERVLETPAEPAAEMPFDLRSTYDELPEPLASALGVDDRPLPVAVGEDGRVVGLLPPALARACAVATLRELFQLEQGHGAAFDTYSADPEVIGFRLEQLLSCPAWVGVRLVEATELDFRVEAAVLEGPAAGQAWAAEEDRPLMPIGSIVPDREALAAEGWLMGEAPPP